MTVGAVSVLRVQVMLGTSWFLSSDAVFHTVTSQTKLGYPAGYQQSWIGRAMWCVTGNAPVSLDRRVFVHKWPLFVRMALNAGRISSGCEAGLLQFETAMRVMAISAAHCAFKDLVMKR